MSYILEALRKSERQRREREAQPLVRLAAYAPAPQKKRWRVAIVILSVAINLAALAVLVRYFPGRESAPQQSSTVAAQPSVDDGAASARTVAGVLSGDAPEPVPPPLSFTESPSAGKPVGTAAEPVAPRPKRSRDLATAPRPPAARMPPQAGPASRALRSAPPTAERADADEPDDEDDDVEVFSRPRPGRKGSPAPFPAARSQKGVRPGPEAYDAPARDTAVDDHLPRPKINVFAYSATAERDRFVVIRGRKYHEGDRLEDGPAVRRIEETSVTLDFEGQTYKVPRP